MDKSEKEKEAFYELDKLARDMKWRHGDKKPIHEDVRRLARHLFTYEGDYPVIVNFLWRDVIIPIMVDFLEDPALSEHDRDLAYIVLFKAAIVDLERNPQLINRNTRLLRTIVRGLPRKSVTLAAASAIRLMWYPSSKLQLLRGSVFVEALANLAERFEGMEQSDSDFLFDMIKDLYESEMASEGFSLPPRHRQLDLVHVALWIVLYEMRRFLGESWVPVPARVAGVVRLGVRLGREDETVGGMACKALTLLCWDDATRREVCQPLDEGFIDSILHLASSTNSKVAVRSLKCLGLIAQEKHIVEKLSNKDSLARLGQVALRKESHVRTAAFLALSRVLKVNHGPALACLPPGLLREAVDTVWRPIIVGPEKDAAYAVLMQVVSRLNTDTCQRLLYHAVSKLERNPDVACQASLLADLELMVSEGPVVVPQNLRAELHSVCDSYRDIAQSASRLLQRCLQPVRDDVALETQAFLRETPIP